MSGTYSGGKKVEKTVKARYGDDYFVNIGRLGGKKSRGGGFAANRELAKIAGRKGGLKSRRRTEAQRIADYEAELAKVDPLK